MDINCRRKNNERSPRISNKTIKPNRKNNGQRPPRTSNRPIRPDRNIVKNNNNSENIIRNSKNIRCYDKLNFDMLNKIKYPRNQPPKPKIPPPSPRPIKKLKNENLKNDNKKKSWSDYSETDDLPEIPKYWRS